MDLLRKVQNYLLPEEFEIHVWKDHIHIVNFTSIGEISSEKIIIRHQNGSIQMKGKDLTLSKLMKDEVLIKGMISQIEFR